MDQDERDDPEADGRIAVLVWMGMIACCGLVSACRSAGLTLTSLRDAVPEAVLATLAIAFLSFAAAFWRRDRRGESTRSRAVENPPKDVAMRGPRAVVVIDGALYIPVTDFVRDLAYWAVPPDLVEADAPGFRRAIDDVRRYVETRHCEDHLGPRSAPMQKF